MRTVAITEVEWWSQDMIICSWLVWGSLPVLGEWGFNSRPLACEKWAKQFELSLWPRLCKNNVGNIHHRTKGLTPFICEQHRQWYQLESCTFLFSFYFHCFKVGHVVRSLSKYSLHLFHNVPSWYSWEFCHVTNDYGSSSRDPCFGTS